jgi:hypothetical protein
MPRYEITAPDGGRYEIIAPDGASEADVLAFAQSQWGAQPKRKPASTFGGSVIQGIRDPIDGGAQLLRRAVPESVGQAIDSFGSWLASKGAPIAPTQGAEGVDTLVRDVNQQYEAGRGPAAGLDVGRIAGNLLNPANYVGGAVKGAATVGALAKAGAVSGAVGGALQPVVNQQNDYWGTKAQQAGSGAAFGAALGPVAAKVGELGAKGIKAAVSKGKGVAVSADRIDVATANALRSGGIDYASLPQQVLDSVKADVAQALRAGAKLDPSAIARKAEFEMVGLSGESGPTLGQLTREPMQFAMEKNLSGIRMDDGGNPLAQRFQAQADGLGRMFDDYGAPAAREPVLAGQDLQQALVRLSPVSKASPEQEFLDSAYAALQGRAASAREPVLAGQDLQQALLKADAPVKASVGQAYDAARAMNDGRSADLNRGIFSQTANKALDDGMWGHFLPPGVRSLLNGVSDGTTPFTVESAEQIDSILAKAQRTAGSGSAEASAIGVIRQALRDTPFAGQADDVGAAAGQALLSGPPSAGQVARDAFGQARQQARNRFKTIDETPALGSALDEEAPDGFVRKYVIGGKLSDLQNLKSVLAQDEAALSQVRAQFAAHLKSAAFGTNAAGDKAFAPERYANALKAIGNEKLKVFFSPEEVVKLNVAAKVAANINSRPAGAAQAVNSSGTAAALFSFLDRIPLAGQRAKQLLRASETDKNIANALNTKSAIGATTLTPEQIETVRKLFAAPASAGGGVAGGSGF